MEKQFLIKFYASDYILHFGSAYIIIFARYNDSGFYGEYFLLIEKPDNSFEHIANSLSSQLSDKELGNIEEFIVDFCFRNVKSYIAGKIFQYSQLGSEIKIPVGEITFDEMKKTSVYLYLISKNKDELEWIHTTTKAPELKEDINIYMDMIVKMMSLG